MRDLYQILRDKELQIMRVQQEVDALRFAIPLLSEEDDQPDPSLLPYATMQLVNSD